MRIGIDVRYLSHGLVGGVHTYVSHFVPALIAQAHEHEIVLYADTKRPFELHSLPRHVAVRFLPWRNAVSSVVNDLFMRRQLAQDQLDVMHYPANYGFGPAGVSTVLTVHDAINLLPLREIVRGHRKHPKTIAMMTYLHYCTRAAVAKASMLLTVSEHARHQIAQQAGADPQRVVAIHHAPTLDLCRITDAQVLNDVRARHQLPKRFVVADALKNPAVLVRAWRKLPAELRTDRRIVFFARHPGVLPIVRAAVEGGLARLLINPSRADLIGLYSMAEAFVFPSWIEGFGIPILEAMTCGAPVIASDRGSIPEVAGDAALLIDAEDASALAQHLELVLQNPPAAMQLQQQGYARAALFSWEETARRMLGAYRQAVGLGSGQSAPAARDSLTAGGH